LRYIYVDRSKISAEWLKKADKVTAEICAEDDEERRKEIIKKRSALWGELKTTLLDMSHQKCWYTEADDCVSDWHVDHFRPKDHYQWLAFDWKNYRIAGAKPNRKKSIHFPLHDQSTRASFEAPDISPEHPRLLDPTVPDDIELILFDEEGVLKNAQPDNKDAEGRIALSSKLLDIDGERLITMRQDIWNRCQSKIDNVRSFVIEKRNCDDALQSKAIKDWAAELRTMESPNSAFSKVAKCCIETNGVRWVRDIPES
jgi:uncharacterized protein (TIGR02646 family)